jgi:hypothetical protein
MPRIRRLATLLVLAHGLAAPANAQSIIGRTIDSASDGPVGLVDIELVNAAGNVLASVTSDWDGRFRLGPLAAGSYTLRTTRLGYADAAVDVTVVPDSVVAVEITLSAAAIAIEGVDVNVSRGPAIEHASTYTGLYTRRGDRRWANVVGPNRVYVSSDFEASRGMTVRRFIRQNAPPSLGRGGLLSSAPPPTPGAPHRRMAGCQPLFLERGGIMLPNWMIEGILERSIAEFEGIEMYSRDYEAPGDLRPDLPSACGVIVVWPKRKPGER